MSTKKTVQELAKFFILLQIGSALMEREYKGLKKEGYSHYTSLSIQAYLAELFSDSTAEEQQRMPWLIKNEERNLLEINWTHINNSLTTQLADIAQNISTNEDSAHQDTQQEQSSELIISQAYQLLNRFYSQKIITNFYQFLAQCVNFYPSSEYAEYYQNDTAYQYLDMLLLDIFEPQEDYPIIILKEAQHHSPINPNEDFTSL